MKGLRALLPAAVAFALSACGGDEHKELRQELAEATKDFRGQVPPLPQVKPYEPVPYTAEGITDPFRPERIEVARKLPRPTTATAIAAAAGASRSRARRRGRPIAIGRSSCSSRAWRSDVVRPVIVSLNSRQDGHASRCACKSTHSKLDSSPSTSVDAH